MDIMHNVAMRIRGKIYGHTHHTQGYLSKSYRAYVKRFLSVHAPSRNKNPLPEHATDEQRMQRMGEAMAEQLFDMASRPSVLRRIFTPNDPHVVAYRQQMSEIDRLVDLTMKLFCPYNRRIDYSEAQVYELQTTTL